MVTRKIVSIGSRSVLIRVRAFSLFLAFLLLSSAGALQGQRSPNSNAYYQQLRGLLPGGEVIAVNNLELRRDAAVFTFRHGNFAFYGEVNGKVTGAVFKGDGHLHITPPTVAERHNLSIVSHTEQFDEDFDQVVLRFTDATAAELHKGSAGKGDADSAYVRHAQEFQTFARRELHDNFDLRILQDVLSPAPGGYFLAGIHGKKNGHLVFTFDPNGVPGISPEEVGLLNWSDWGQTYPLAFHRSDEYANGTVTGNEHNAAYHILNEKLDVSIEKSGFLSSLATVEVRAEQEGVAVIPLDLFPTLRVSRAETGKGDSLDWVQEKKEDDPDFGVVLTQPLKKGETATLKITYGGKEVVINEGSGNYYPVARENWYPNANQGLGDYANYQMTFHVAKGLQLIATGTKVRESTDGGITTSEWKTEVPLAVVGFSMGDFLEKEAKFGNPVNAGGELIIDAYANKQVPDFVAPLANQGLGTLNTTPMLADELSQGEVAARLYTNYFGALSFPHISLTQQSACNYGQSWPMLVYLPICGFFDSTQQHFLGLHDEDMYWKVVTPHEVAHQWWGQTVGFRSYRDQWMSEGFANTSATIFLQATRPKPTEFLEFWKQQRKLITEKNSFGFRPIDVGPVTMGFRLMSPKAGWNVYQNLVYPKGAYILHMVRMMMWSTADGDARFKATMHDFLESHRMQAATTEDFKTMVEKHMTQAMDLDSNHKMDWFFNEYVYGIELPTYHFQGQVTQDGDKSNLHFTLVQSGVSPGFKMTVPVYLEFADGKVTKLGSIGIVGSNTIERNISLGKLPAAVKRVSINYYYDVLSLDN
jgi:Peptidase family M1 domain